MLTALKRRSRGFTLVELLVVIGIIAVLVGILLPTLSSARQSARLVQCQSNLRQFFIADAMYLNTYKNWHLPGWTGSDVAGGYPAPKPFSSFTKNQDIWTGMEEVRRTLSIAWLPSGVTGAAAYRAYIPPERCCPEAVRGGNDQHQADATTGFKDWYVDYFYGMNVDGVDYSLANATDPVYQPVKAPQCDVTLDTPAGTVKSFHGFRAVQVRHPADKIFLCDAMYWWVNEYGSGVSLGWQGAISDYGKVGERTHTGNLPAGGAYNSERTVAWRHKKTLANVCFFDGHVEAVSKDRFTIKDPATGTLTPNLQMWRPME